MEKFDSESLLTKLMGGNDLGWKDFSSPPPWHEIYSPLGFIEAMTVAIDRVQAKSVHYAGLADETILRWICSLESTNVSVMDMVDWWGMDRGDDEEGDEPLKSRLPPELTNVAFYSEGSPRNFQVLIQDMRFGENALVSFYRRMVGVPHCVAYLGLAIEQCRRSSNYEWQCGTGYLIGVSNVAARN